MAGILLSRVLGFVREWVVAHQVGSNAMTEGIRGKRGENK